MISRRTFARTLGGMVAGCFLAMGLKWKEETVFATWPLKCVPNPDYANAKYEVHYIWADGVKPKFCGPPPRSNNPNAINDEDFIFSHKWVKA